MERVPVDDVFVDEFLTEVCGFEVNGHVFGHITFRAFPNDDDVVVRELNNYALTAVYSSAQATIRVKDVGVDRVSFQADGSIVNVIVGSVQSISIPGHGRVYSDVGQTTVHITFDENGDASVEILSSQRAARRRPGRCAVRVPRRLNRTRDARPHTLRGRTSATLRYGRAAIAWSTSSAFGDCT